MPPQELIRKWKVNRGITTHVKRKSPLYGKRASNNFIIIKLLSMHILTERNYGNGTNN